MIKKIILTLVGYRGKSLLVRTDDGAEPETLNLIEQENEEISVMQE